MTWAVSTSTARSTGSSSMGSNTTLNRSTAVIPTANTLTGYELQFQIDLGAGAGTYGSIGVGVGYLIAPFYVGLSLVPSGGTAPNLITAPDDASFLWVSNLIPQSDRETINTTASTSANYQDLFFWSGAKRARVQIPVTGAAVLTWHIANQSGATEPVNWEFRIRATYAVTGV